MQNKVEYLEILVSGNTKNSTEKFIILSLPKNDRRFIITSLKYYGERKFVYEEYTAWGPLMVYQFASIEV
jgi:hypothetical protein